MANIYQPRNMLVTGSAGFIGSNFVHHLLEADSLVRIFSLDKLTYAGNLKNLENLPAPSRHTFYHGDICDRNLVNHLLRQHEIDTIVHFAAESHVDRSISNPVDFIETNINGTFNLLDIAHKYWLNEKKWDEGQCRFHHISTDEVYGELGPHDLPFTENSPYKPSSPYSASKAAADHLVKAYIRTYNLPATISNSSNNYGPRQHPEKLIPTIIRCCLENKPIPVYGNGSNIRDWLFVEDHCSAIHMILKRGKIGESYNIGGNAEKDNLSIVQMICDIMDKQQPIQEPYQKLISFVTDRRGHDWRYAINITKIHQKLGWKPQYSLSAGLKKIL